MRRTARRAPMPYPVRVPLLALTAAMVLALLPGAALAAKQPTRAVAKQVENATLGKTVLTTLGGRTLYSLSVERGGRFVCDNPGCLAAWRPLLIARATKPTGPVPLDWKVHRIVERKGVKPVFVCVCLWQGTSKAVTAGEAARWHQEQWDRLPASTQQRWDAEARRRVGSIIDL